MNTYIWLVIVVIFAYLLGSISSAVILSKIFFKHDIREEGSGNAGATNMLRTYGKKFGVATLIFDALKGVIAVIVANFIKNTVGGDTEILRLLPYLGGFFAVIGHNFPLFFKFKGGKGVATSLGVVLALNPKVALIVAAVAIAIMAVSGYVSLGSVSAGILYIAADLTYMVTAEAFYLPELIFSVLLASLLIARHHANIKRLLNGTENKLWKKKK